jgi:hypothetical protein
MQTNGVDEQIASKQDKSIVLCLFFSPYSCSLAIFCDTLFYRLALLTGDTHQQSMRISPAATLIRTCYLLRLCLNLNPKKSKKNQLNEKLQKKQLYKKIIVWSLIFLNISKNYSKKIALVVSSLPACYFKKKRIKTYRCCLDFMVLLALHI